MKAIHLYGAGDIRFEEKPQPPAPADGVVVKVDACGICGSDVSFVKMGSFFGPDTPMPLGHEFAGTIVETGSAVTGLRAGTRVVVDPMRNDALIGCGHATAGAFAEYVAIPQAEKPGTLFALPEHVASDIAALCEPIAVAMHAVNTGEAHAGMRVVVYGAGPIGLGAVVSLQHKGVEDITVIDYSPSRLQLARQLGARQVHNPSDGKTSRFLRETLGQHQSAGGSGIDADLFIDAAGAAPALQEMVKLARYRARIVVVAMHKAAVEIDMAAVMAKELQLCGSIGYPAEFPQVLELVSSWNEKLRPMISHRFALNAFDEALEVARDPQHSAKVLIVQP